MAQIFRIFKTIRSSLFSGFNKEFLIFLFFLALSTAYWLMSVLNDTMEREVTVSVHLANIPRNIIILNDSDYQVQVVLRDKGYTLAAYYFGDRLKPLQVDFNTYVISNEKVVIPASEIQKLLTSQLFRSTKIVSIKTERITYSFNYGQHKRVPVRLAGTVTPDDTYYLARTLFSPDSVDVYASRTRLDSIHEVYTQKVNITHFRDTLQKDITLRAIRGVKMVPSQVRLTLIPDIMTEMRISVPITSINVPQGKRLRTFPTRIEVKYVIGALQYHDIDSTAFLVTADYNSTEDGTAEQCKLRLVKAPRLARSPHLTENSVNYLIEQNSTPEQ